mmetsp:Transcript_1667/g.3277  ORF Transcript_1667/g.3277 Transcript_1667/m.3277 type:complete len:429 (-) Transcript_1667:727-2013(-)
MIGIYEYMNIYIRSRKNTYGFKHHNTTQYLNLLRNVGENCVLRQFIIWQTCLVAFMFRLLLQLRFLRHLMLIFVIVQREPRVLNHIVDQESLVRVEAQHVVEQRQHFHRNEVVAFPLEQQLINNAVLHVQIRLVRVDRFVVRWTADQHAKQDHTQTPHVRFACIKHTILAINFGRFVIGFPAIFCTMKRIVSRFMGRGRTRTSLLVKYLRQSKVAQFDLHITVDGVLRLCVVEWNEIAILDQDVLEREIEMARVHVIVQPTQHHNHLPKQVLCEFAPFLDLELLGVEQLVRLDNIVKQVRAAMLHAQEIKARVVKEIVVLCETGHNEAIAVLSQILQNDALFQDILVNAKLLAILHGHMLRVQRLGRLLDHHLTLAASVHRSLGDKNAALQCARDILHLLVAKTTQDQVVHIHTLGRLALSSARRPRM